MSPYLTTPLVPDIRGLQSRASARGTSLESEVSEFVARETGGVRPDAIAALDARQSKLESQLAQIETDRQRQLGIAAKFHSLNVERDRLAKQLEVAKGKLELHRASAAEAFGHAKLRLGDTADQWTIAGNLLGISLEQSAIVTAMGPLVDELAAQVATAEEAVLSFGREHGITPTAQPKG